ncbi:SRPBCC domain-containing protein [Aquimarina sp. Aq78]|uniref:SRPBCC domain-containing protein n=1 Tax=Aquimarina sp. Aq78 TaxID=1191889 RepID=UPI000D111514|nr:SRPBCC domain-containing protein [Aquimarina sp. Aq78]
MKTRFSLLVIISLLLIGCKSKNTIAIMMIEKEIQFNANKEKVWGLLTNPTITKQYMYGCEVISDWEVESLILWKGQTEDGKEVTYVKGKIVECKKGELVTFTMFDPNMEIEDIPENYLSLTYDLKEKNNKTILKLTQGNFATVALGEKRYKESLKGWEMVIPIMKQIVEK